MMTDEGLARFERLLKDRPNSAWTDHDVSALLAEVKRLRRVVELVTSFKAQLGHPNDTPYTDTLDTETAFYVEDQIKCNLSCRLDGFV